MVKALFWYYVGTKLQNVDTIHQNLGIEYIYDNSIFPMPEKPEGKK